MTDFWKRVRNLLTQDLNQNWLAGEIGVAPATLSNWMSRDVDPKMSRIQAIAKAFGVSEEQLITGKTSGWVELDSVDTNAVKKIPFFQVDITSENIEKIQSSTIQPQYTISLEPFKRCDFCIPMSGDSMEPKISHGDIVVLRRLQSMREVLWGEMYLINTLGTLHLCTLKSLFQDPESPDTVILRSLNPSKSGDNFLPKSTIKDIYKVVGSVRQFLF